MVFINCQPRSNCESLELPLGCWKLECHASFIEMRGSWTCSQLCSSTVHGFHWFHVFLSHLVAKQKRLHVTWSWRWEISEHGAMLKRNSLLENVIFRFSVLLWGCRTFFWMFFLSKKADKWQSLRYLFMNSPQKTHPYHIPILKVEDAKLWQNASEWIWCWCRFWHVHRGVVQHFRGLWFYISVSIDKKGWDLTMAGAWLKMAGSVIYIYGTLWNHWNDHK